MRCTVDDGPPRRWHRLERVAVPTDCPAWVWPWPKAFARLCSGPRLMDVRPTTTAEIGNATRTAPWPRHSYRPHADRVLAEPSTRASKPQTTSSQD
jgi:hypothetical protein